MVTKRLSTQPYKGTRDLFPDELRVQKYIFDTWRRVCESFGYDEYQTPLLEPADIYRAKSGDDVGGKELFTLTDMGGRELALRPELTPSVTRMVCRRYKELPKPIRLFSIGSFYRGEAPQRGRNREFWQLNADIFGERSLNADIEVLQLALEIMLAFNPPEGSFKLFLNSRKLLNTYLDSLGVENKLQVSRVLDKYQKLEPEAFGDLLTKAELNTNQIANLQDFMKGDNQKKLEKCDGYNDIQGILKTLKDMGYEKYVEFKPSLIRGFDYYDGMVFEVFDTKEENNRSMFGGGRYNGLADLFGSESFPAVGFAPGDETTKLFLESWDLIPSLNRKTRYYLFPLSNQAELASYMSKIAQRIRFENKAIVVTDLSEKKLSIEEGLREANRRNYDYAVFFGENEIQKNGYTMKDLKTGEQTFFNL